MNNLVLGDSLEFLADHRGKTPKKLNSDFVTTGVPVASAIMVKNGRLNLDDARYVSLDLYRQWMAKPVLKGDVLLTSEAPLGRVARVGDNLPLVLGQRLFGLRGKQGVLDSGFLYYALQTDSVQSDLNGRSSGSTVSGIRQSALRKISIPAPSYKIQMGIAEALGSVDNKIDINYRIIETSENLSIALSAVITKTSPLLNLVKISRDVLAPVKFGIDSVWHYSLPAYDAGKLPTQDSPDSIKSGKFMLRKPAVLVSKLNPRFPRVWSVPSLAPGLSVASTEFVILEPKFGTPEFLWSLLAQPTFGLALEGKVVGTSGSHQRVRPSDLLNTPVGDPRMAPPQLMETVTQMVKLAQHAREENVTLATLRDTLLPELMSGRMRVREAEELVGEVL